MLGKNDITELEITSLTSEGSGIGRVDGMVVFVPFSAVGDKLSVRILKVKASCAYGKIESIISPSADRISPDCSCFGKCGGCVYRHISYEAELKAKETAVRDAFFRIGSLSPEFLPIAAGENVNGYRNKLQMPYGTDKEGRLVCGFFAPHSHRVVPCDECLLQPKLFSLIIKEFTSLCERSGVAAYNEKDRSGVLRHICLRKGHYSGEVCLCIVAAREHTAFKEIALGMVGAFREICSVVLNINPDDTNVILGKEEKLLFGRSVISDTMCGRSVELSIKSFYQVNTPQAERLYKFAAEAADLDGKILLDLYCGAGTVGLSVADRVSRLIGVEAVPEAVENARKNAISNGIKNAEFICADAGKAAKMLADRGVKPDVIIIDPPRKGCDEEAVKNIAAFGAERIVMISCNAATAARDCARLAVLGYDTVNVRPVDMFPRTNHVECVVLLSKLKTAQHIEVELQTDELDLTAAESKATYDEIRDYVKKQTGLTVSSLNVAQVKDTLGMDKRENFNKPKSDNFRQPKCPKDKADAIVEALKHFKMI